MKTIQSALIALLGATITLPALSADRTPDDLLYAGAPIDARCFTNLDRDTKSPVHLKNCGLQHEQLSKTNANADLIREGYIGADWKGKEKYEYGFDYYKAFKAGPHQFWIYSSSNGGGTGNFTNISLMKRESNDSMSLKSVADGDRCNSGIDDVSLQKDHLQYHVYLTPFDLYQLGNDRTKLAAYDDLAACAICCIGKAVYAVDLKLTPKLQYVELEAIKNQDEMPTQGSHEMCFNRILANAIQAGKTRLQEKELKALVEKFNVNCVDER